MLLLASLESPSSTSYSTLVFAANQTDCLFLTEPVLPWVSLSRMAQWWRWAQPKVCSGGKLPLREKVGCSKWGTRFLGWGITAHEPRGYTVGVPARGACVEWQHMGSHVLGSSFLAMVVWSSWSSPKLLAESGAVLSSGLQWLAPRALLSWQQLVAEDSKATSAAKSAPV